MSIQALHWAFGLPIKPSLKKFVLVVLCNYATETNKTYPSMKALTHGTGASKEAVEAALLALVENKVIHDTGKRAGPASDIIVWELLPNETPVVVPKKTNRKASPETEEAVKIYDLYPRKVSRPNAIRAIMAAVKKDGFENVHNGTKLFADAFRASGKQIEYCPHPATWFRAERYFDKLSDQGLPEPRKHREPNQVNHAPTRSQLLLWFKEKVTDNQKAERYAKDFYAHWDKSRWMENGKPIEWQDRASKQLVVWRQLEASPPTFPTISPPVTVEDPKTEQKG